VHVVRMAGGECIESPRTTVLLTFDRLRKIYLRFAARWFFCCSVRRSHAHLRIATTMIVKRTAASSTSFLERRASIRSFDKIASKSPLSSLTARHHVKFLDGSRSLTRNSNSSFHPR
jgi:hypothetical protein